MYPRLARVSRPAASPGSAFAGEAACCTDLPAGFAGVGSPALRSRWDFPGNGVGSPPGIPSTLNPAQSLGTTPEDPWGLRCSSGGEIVLPKRPQQSQPGTGSRGPGIGLASPLPPRGSERVGRRAAPPGGGGGGQEPPLAPRSFCRCRRRRRRPRRAPRLRAGRARCGGGGAEAGERRRGDPGQRHPGCCRHRHPGAGAGGGGRGEQAGGTRGTGIPGCCTDRYPEDPGWGGDPRHQHPAGWRGPRDRKPTDQQGEGHRHPGKPGYQQPRALQGSAPWGEAGTRDTGVPG